MRMVAISKDYNICTGLKLAGVDSYQATTEEELIKTLSGLANIDVVITTSEVNKTKAFENFSKANPHIQLFDINDSWHRVG